VDFQSELDLVRKMRQAFANQGPTDAAD